MAFKQSLEGILIKFANINPAVVSASIATAKGIFRPTFTMMDKKENFETKRYIAIREGLTELIAIPVYLGSGLLSKALTNKLAKPEKFMSKELFNKYKSGDTSKEVLEAFKHAEEMVKMNKPKMGAVSAFAGVCLSALIIIPWLCSITIKPIMKGIEKRGAKKKTAEQPVADIKPLQQPQVGNLNTFKSLYTRSNYGMKVGGV